MYSTQGVLPVPPSVRLPTLITGTPTHSLLFQPRSYSALRRVVAQPYGTLARRRPSRSRNAPAPLRRPLITLWKNAVLAGRRFAPLLTDGPSSQEEVL